MSVTQRKLFSSKDARSKLRDMGGIMSSFPELSSEVQNFADGTEVVAPSGSAGRRETRVRPSPLAAPPVTYQQWLSMSSGERQRMGLPTSDLGGEMYFNRFGVGMGFNDSETGLPVLPPGSAGRRETRMPIQTDEPAPTPRSGGRGPMRLAPVQGPPMEDAPATDAPATDAPGTDTGVPIYEQRIAELLPPSAEEGAGEGEGAGAGAGAGADKPTLRSLAEDRIKLFQDLFGADEPSARDRAMQFAMIGLAVAAGQSPNALTNLASGLLAGTQAMSEQEAGRRDRAQDLRKSALESVLAEASTARELSSTRREEIRTGWQEVYLAALNDAASVGETTSQGAAKYATETANEWLLSTYPGVPTFPVPGANEAATAAESFPEDMLPSEQALM